MLTERDLIQLRDERHRDYVSEHVGVSWWNSLSEADRLFWCRAAITAVPADAWAYYVRVTDPS